MSIWKALFGKPEPRKSNTSYPGEPPASYNPRPTVRNCDAGKRNDIGFFVDRDCGNAKQFEIDPECGDAFDPYWEKFDEWYEEKINLLKSQGRSFFVFESFRGHDEGAEVYYRICESREQMEEEVYKSYDDMTDSYIPHEFILHVVAGEEVATPPEWWTDYEASFQETEKLRQWQRTSSSRYRL
jgi:hypothetical protein